MTEALSERNLRLARKTDAIAQQVLASGELQGHVGVVRIHRNAFPDFSRKQWTTTCLVPSGHITLIHIGRKDQASKGGRWLDFNADELDHALAMKYPIWSDGWADCWKRDWWARKHSMKWICQRNYYQ